MTPRTTARPTIVRISVAAPLPDCWAAALGAASERLRGVPSPLAPKAAAGSTRRPPRAAESGRVSTKFRTEDHSLHRPAGGRLEDIRPVVPACGHAPPAGHPRAGDRHG